MKFKEELLARLTEASAREAGLLRVPTEAQKLLDGEGPPSSAEGDGSGDFDPRGAKTLVLRLFDVDDTPRLQPKEGHYRSFPVGRAVPNLRRAMQTATQQPKSVTVSLSLRGEEQAGVLLPDHSEGGGLSRSAELETRR